MSINSLGLQRDGQMFALFLKRNAAPKTLSTEGGIWLVPFTSVDTQIVKTQGMLWVGLQSLLSNGHMVT